MKAPAPTNPQPSHAGWEITKQSLTTKQDKTGSGPFY